MKKLIVDPGLCITCENCVSLCPEVFEIGEDGVSQVKNQDACSKCDCDEAIESCPVEAISWEE
jgi:ferredoxin